MCAKGTVSEKEGAEKQPFPKRRSGSRRLLPECAPTRPKAEAGAGPPPPAPVGHPRDLLAACKELRAEGGVPPVALL